MALKYITKHLYKIGFYLMAGFEYLTVMGNYFTGITRFIYTQEICFGEYNFKIQTQQILLNATRRRSF